jgi:hypothetical protein
LGPRWCGVPSRDDGSAEVDVSVKAYEFASADTSSIIASVRTSSGRTPPACARRTPFLARSPHARDLSRFYAHALGGFDNSTVMGPRAVVILGGGVDDITIQRATDTPPYCVHPSAGRRLRSRPRGRARIAGFRFLFGVVIGPHQ